MSDIRERYREQITAVDDRSHFPFGIKFRLSLALGGLAALTLVASLVAWLVFGHIQRSVSAIVSTNVPEITLALQIAQHSSELITAAPAISASETQDARLRQIAVVDHVRSQLDSLIGEWAELGIPSDDARELRAQTGMLLSQIRVIDASTEQRISVAERLSERTGFLSSVHSQFLETLEPLIDDSVFDLVIGSEDRNAESADAIREGLDQGTTRLTNLMSLRESVSRLNALYLELLRSGEADVRATIEEALAVLEDRIGDVLVDLGDTADAAYVSKAVDDILGFHPSQENISEVAGEADGPGDPFDYRGFDRARESFDDVISAMIDATQTALVATIESQLFGQSRSIVGMIDAGTNRINNLLVLRAEGNLAAGLLNEAANSDEFERLTPLADRFEAAAGQIDRALRDLPQGGEYHELRVAAGAIVDFGRGEGGIFALHRVELQERDKARDALAVSNSVSDKLAVTITSLVDAAKAASERTAAESDEVIGDTSWLIGAIAVVGLGSALAVLFFYVNPYIIRPIQSMTRSMTNLAHGDTSVEIPGRDRNDEIGNMAEALGVFRDITIEIQKSNLHEIETGRRRLLDAIESISEAFSLYDADDRLIVFNRMYATLVHPELKDEIHAGMRFEEIIRKAVAIGNIQEAKGREEAWIADRLKAHRNPDHPRLMQRHDGIWIMVSEHRTAEGGIVAVYSDITELKERETELAAKSQALEQLSNQLSKYLSPQIYQSIFSGQRSAEVTAQRKKLTIFFSDLVGFTETSDRLVSEDLTQMLNHYLTEMSTIALAHGATIDKFIGDAIMIFFGDPVSHGVKADALACVNMAIAMQKRLDELADFWRSTGLAHPLRCRIGITTGYCTVGNFGSENRMDYTIIGGMVNLASRLESAAEPGTILVSDETYGLIRDQVACEAGETLSVKGIAYPVKSYRVIDTHENLRKGTGRISEHHAKFALDANVAAMSEEERKEAARVLEKALSEVSGKEKGGAV